MKIFVLLLTAFLFVSAKETAFAASSAQAEFVNAQGARTGTAIITETAEGVKIVLDAEGLPAGNLAIHIHSAGVCTGPDFSSAGPHYNPEGKKHGLENVDGAHAGDLPNLQVKADGTLHAEITARDVFLNGGRHSLLAPPGTALVIHAGPDDGKTDPSGNSGARIACGVIQEKVL